MIASVLFCARLFEFMAARSHRTADPPKRGFDFWPGLFGGQRIWPATLGWRPQAARFRQATLGMRLLQGTLRGRDMVTANSPNDDTIHGFTARVPATVSPLPESFVR